MATATEKLLLFAGSLSLQVSAGRSRSSDLHCEQALIKSSLSPVVFCNIRRKQIYSAKRITVTWSHLVSLKKNPKTNLEIYLT